MALPAFFFISIIDNISSMEEIWKPVVGYEGLYEVSNFGRVRSLNYNHTKTSRIMTPWVSLKDYDYIHLCNGTTVKSCRVARLVAMAFIPNPDNKPFVDHIDTNRRNNRADNLRWCNQSENQKNPISRKRYGAAKSFRVVQLTKDNQLIQIWSSIAEAKREGGFNKNQISKVCNGRLKTHHGYKWQYLSDYGKEEC